MERVMSSACCGGMWIVGLIGLLLLVVLVLSAVALVKYLFARNTPKKHDHD
jgi:hypothetical protein